MKKCKKIISSILLMITLISLFQSIVLGATEISSANLKSTHPINTNIQFYDETQMAWVALEAEYICCTVNNKTYPAYCITHRIRWCR